VLAGLRVFHNRWAERVWKRIWLVLFVYACVILALGVIEIVRRSSEGNFP